MAKSISKKMVALLLMAVMVVVMGVTSITVFADVTYPTSGNCIILKDGKTSVSDTSMANDALVKAVNSKGEETIYGSYTATTSGDNVIVTIPIQKIYKLGLYGYINSETEVYVGSTPITYTVTSGYYDTGTFVLTIPDTCFTENGSLVTSIKLDIKFGITLSSSKHSIETSMEPNADMYIYVNPSQIVK